MGYFRRHKIRNHTAEEVSGLCDEARDSVVEAAQKSASNEEIEERMTNWGFDSLSKKVRDRPGFPHRNHKLCMYTINSLPQT